MFPLYGGRCIKMMQMCRILGVDPLNSKLIKHLNFKLGQHKFQYQALLLTCLAHFDSVDTYA